MVAPYEAVASVEGIAHYNESDLAVLLALGFREVADYVQHDPALPAPMGGKLLISPDGSALASLHGLGSTDPFIEIRTLLTDGALVQTVRQRMAQHPHLATMAQGYWSGLAMTVTPGVDRAPLETVWEEHQEAVRELVQLRGAEPVQGGDLELWMATDDRVRLPFRRVRLALLILPFLLVACGIGLAAATYTNLTLALISPQQMLLLLWVGLTPVGVAVVVLARGGPKGAPKQPMIRVVSRLPGPPPQTESELRRALRNAGT